MINWNEKVAMPGAKLVLITKTALGHVRRDVTLREARQILLANGLNVTTKEAVEWGTQYPHEAANLTRICLLQQRIADLRHRLRTRGRHV